MKVFLSLFMIAVLMGTIACIERTQEPARTPLITYLPEVYENTYYGFSIRYPEAWASQEGDTGEAILIIHNPNYSFTTQILVEELDQPISAEEFAESAMGNFDRKLRSFQVISQGRITLGDDTAYEYVFRGIETDEPLIAKLICTVRENRMFSVLAAAHSSIYDLLSQQIDNTIYSFRLQEPFSMADIPRNESLILYGVPPITLDPAVILDTDSALFVQEIFSGLVALNQELEIVPDIAQKWDISKDGTVYTFHLREGVVFHDSTPVTADDFKYSIERACDPETGSQIAGSYLNDIVGAKEKLAGEAEEVAGVTVVNDHTLQITIDGPKAHFLSKLLYPTAFVVDQKNVEAEDEWWRHPNGTGPFKAGIWKEDELLVLERNEKYYREAAKVERVVFRLWAGNPMTMYEQGEIDMTLVYGANILRVTDPASELHPELIITPELSFNFVSFNASQPPFDDPDIRRAFCHAIDKQKIMNILFEDTVFLAEGILPPALPGYSEDINGLEFNPVKARELIEQSGYGSAEALPPIVYTASGRGIVSPLTEAMIDMWEEHLEVEIMVRQIDPEIYAYTIKKEKDHLFDIGWMADYPDPHNFLDILFYSESGDNIGEYSNREVDTRLEAARDETNVSQRFQIYQEVEQMLVDDAACLPLYFGKEYTLVKPYVKGYSGMSLQRPWLADVSIEPHE